MGFTPLSEARDPEEVRELLSRYFDLARTVIGRYGGTVEKFIGDAVMAVWGAPVAVEGDTERAVRAALDVVDAVADLGGQVGVATLAARAGVVTGEVAVTIGAVGQGMVAGDPVNTAARVQSAAAPGSVLVDSGTWRAARGAVTFESAGDHVLKGKARPVPLWRAERVVCGVGGSQRIDGLEARLVGRDAELRLVKELFHACIERRSARLVSVVGPAGVGKSRLGWEFEKYVDGLATVVAWHRGHCLSYGDGVAFWALAEIVRQRLDITEDDPASVVARKLTAGLDTWVPDPAAREYIRPRLAQLLGVESVSGADGLAREELFAGWRLFFEQLAATAPVVLLVEDLQHADPGLLDFIEHLLDWARRTPIFVLTLARSELEDGRPGWGAGRRNGTVLNVEPLDSAATLAMLDELVPGMPEPAKQAVTAQAQGIPLYAIETVRMLIDLDVVQPVDGVYRLVGDIGRLDVPDSLQSLLAARLDALEPDARRLVGDAAVLGGRFPAEALVAVSAAPADDVRRVLADLVRREVLAVSADPLSPERGQYQFVQSMVRQVAYDMLSRRERKARHITVAAHLQRVFPDDGTEVSEVVASHLLDALAAVPDDPDVPELRARAVTTLIRGGERAQRTGALAVAARAYATASGLLAGAADVEDDLSAAGLAERAGEAARRAADYIGAAEHYRGAAETYLRHGRSRGAARARVGQGRALRRHGRLDDARTVLLDALAELETDPDADTVSAMLELARLETYAGRDVDHLVQTALDHAQALGLPDATLAELFLAQGIAYNLRGRPAQAVAVHHAAARLAEGGDEGLVARILLNLADVLVLTDPVAAADAARGAVARCRRVGLREMLPVATANLLLALVMTGDWDAADAAHAAAVDDGIDDDPHVAVYGGLMLGALRTGTVLPETVAATEQFARSQDAQAQGTLAFSRAFAAVTVGDAAAALAHAREALSHAAELGVAHEAIRWAWPVAADSALALGDLAAVQQLLEWLDSHRPGHVPPMLRTERARIAARLLAARHDPRADKAFTDAVCAARDLGSHYHLAVGLLDHAEHLAVTTPGEAVVAAEEARTIAGRLGAQPLLRRAEMLTTPISTVTRSPAAAVGAAARSTALDLERPASRVR